MTKLALKVKEANNKTKEKHTYTGDTNKITGIKKHVFLCCKYY